MSKDMNRAVPGTDYIAMVPIWGTGPWDAIHMMVRTDAEQPDAPWVIDGYQIFNEIYEYSRLDFVSMGLYTGSLRPSKRMELVDRLEKIYSAHAEMWIRDGIYFEHPTGAWLLNDDIREPRRICFDVEDTNA